jgi:SAM-dependent methyltransferase
MPEKNEKKYFVDNQNSWNSRVSIHKDSAFYDVVGFKSGRNVLNDIELNEVGDVRGQSMLHLQCHFGLDTMSWSRLGAKTTGVDFSDEAIRLAKDLCRDQNLDAQFICCNIYDLKEHLTKTYDIIFTSYGVIGWLPDLNKWAEIINHFLNPGGFFYMVEFHPVLWMFDDDFKEFAYSYFKDGVIEIDQEGTYADKDAKLLFKEYSWNHSLSEVFKALMKQGLDIDLFSEYDYSPYNCFPNMIEKSDRKFYIRGFEHKLPMVYSIRAKKHLNQ